MDERDFKTGNEIPIYEIYNSGGDKIGFFFDKEIAEKVTMFLAKGLVYNLQLFNENELLKSKIKLFRQMLQFTSRIENVTGEEAEYWLEQFDKHFEIAKV